MGYYTRYTLEIEPPVKGVAAAMRKISEEFGWFRPKATGWEGDECEPSKWYNHDADMRALSARFPDATFTLSGEGDEQGDVWVKVYKGGTTVKAKRARLAMEDDE